MPFCHSGQLHRTKLNPFACLVISQNTFEHQTRSEFTFANNSFALQQLNLFFQKHLGNGWSSFVNFEVLNNFSSSRRWGSFNLEEAWIKYNANLYFSLKLGLQIPIFNNLNEVKNRTPLLPYVVRPLVYESSFGEIIAVEEYLPQRAFAQVYGFLPSGKLKFDYAVYVGNSPNISTRDQHDRSGIDTTATFLVGGRVGLRYKDFKVGFSATRDNVNDFRGAEIIIPGEEDRFSEVPRFRFGTDLSYQTDKFLFEAEFIRMRYSEDLPELTLRREFYYGTLGYYLTENLFAYATYWVTDDFAAVNLRDEIEVPGIGISYRFSDGISFKAQTAKVRIKGVELVDKYKYTFWYHALAASVFF